MIEPQSPMDYSVTWMGNKQKRMGFIQKKSQQIYTGKANTQGCAKNLKKHC